MDKADWEKVKKTLWAVGCYVTLRCDEYEVKLMRLPGKGLTDIIAPIINGKMLTREALNDCEERRRFCCQHKYKIPLKDLGMNAKEYNKLSQRDRKALDERRTYSVWYPWWENFNSMRSHFERENNKVEIKEQSDVFKVRGV